jgi:hypothetical protein
MVALFDAPIQELGFLKLCYSCLHEIFRFLEMKSLKLLFISTSITSPCLRYIWPKNTSLSFHTTLHTEKKYKIFMKICSEN